MWHGQITPYNGISFRSKYKSWCPISCWSSFKENSSTIWVFEFWRRIRCSNACRAQNLVRCAQTKSQEGFWGKTFQSKSTNISQQCQKETLLLVSTMINQYLYMWREIKAFTDFNLHIALSRIHVVISRCMFVSDCYTLLHRNGWLT